MENLLSKRVKDKITGFVGIVVSRHEYRNGCIQYGIQGNISKDGIIPDIIHSDEDDLEIIGEVIKEKEKKSNPGGGIRKYPEL